MIKIFLNWIKTAITPHRQKDDERQDPHLEMYEKLRPDKAEKIRKKYKEVSE